MTELTGFSPVTRLTPDALPPQSIRVPDDIDAMAECASNCLASTIIKAIRDVVSQHISENVQIEVLNRTLIDGTIETMLRIAPLQPDAVARPIGNPGDWLVIDNNRLSPMCDADYAAQFSYPNQSG